VYQTRDLVRSRERLLRAGPGRRRQAAGDDADDEKRHQRHPVVRIGDGEVTDGRQEEIVEAQRRRKGGGHGDGEVSHRGHEQRDQQVAERDRGRVVDVGDTKQQRDGRDTREAQRQLPGGPNRHTSSYRLPPDRRLYGFLTPRRIASRSRAGRWSIFLVEAAAARPPPSHPPRPSRKGLESTTLR